MKKDVPQLLTSFKPGTGIKHAFCYALVLQLHTQNPTCVAIAQAPIFSF